MLQGNAACRTYQRTKTAAYAALGNECLSVAHLDGIAGAVLTCMEAYSAAAALFGINVSLYLMVTRKVSVVLKSLKALASDIVKRTEALVSKVF